MFRTILHHPIVAAILLLLLLIVLRFLYAIRGALWRQASVVFRATYYLTRPQRKRHIPLRVRRQVIARHQRATGLVYDPTRDHIDHIVPFARGGNHSTDNLRIIPKTDNLRKGKSWPSPLDLFWIRRPLRRARASQSGAEDRLGDATHRVG